ncbi:hypothetical protein [Neorhodopirellula lusitana]|uniref:hypothetical protein n=1 Tax=Neorhodopirellula lusitana TaxID=445327 RepID=UPI00384F61B2
MQRILKAEDAPEISIWLCVDPTLAAPDGERWNINMALEQRIIMEHQPEWNKRGRTKPTTGSSFHEIIANKNTL